MSNPAEISRLLIELRHAQRVSWERGQPIFVEAYLEQYPELTSNKEAVLSFIYGEYCLREEFGEKPTAREYFQRFTSYADKLGPLLQMHTAMPQPGRSGSIETHVTVDLPTKNMSSPDEETGDAQLQLREVGRCRILERVGEGGMGSVYRGHHHELDMEVAIKFLHAHLVRKPEAAQRFLKEAQLAARLSHPGIVRVFDCGSQSGQYYIVMEFVRGRDLRKWVASGKQFSVKEVLDIGINVARTLNEALQKIGMIHRDIKPDNIIWTSPGEIKVADLGIAKVMAEHAAHASNFNTSPGALLGTPQYMSPEQFSDLASIDHRADIYSLGATLYYLLAKRSPFIAGSILEMQQRIQQEPPDPLPRHVPLFVEEIVFRMLAKSADDRFLTYDALIVALEDSIEKLKRNLQDVAPEPSFSRSIPAPAVRADTRSIQPATPSEDRVLLIVDIQNDFCPGGPLGVPNGDEVIPIINDLSRRFAHVIVTQDWHRADHLSFASSHPGRKLYDRVQLAYGEQILWPDHCVQGTRGAELHPALDVFHCELVIRKGYIREIDSYSAFFENDRKTPTGLTGYLRERGFSRLFIVGLATDFCVAFTAIDARRLGFEVTVIEKACRGIDIDGSIESAWKEMTAAGVIRA